MTRKTQSALRPRQASAAPQAPQPASVSNFPRPILRPVSDPSPGAPATAKTAGKTSKGPFSSLTFAAGTAFPDGGGAKKSRKGVLGFFQQHKKEGSDASSLGYSSSGFDTASTASGSSDLPTPTSPTFADLDGHRLQKGSIGRGLWGRLTGTVREHKSSTTSTKLKPVGSTKAAIASFGRSAVAFPGSLSHAPPFPAKRVGSTTINAPVERLAPPKTLSSVFQPEQPPSLRSGKPRTLSSAGPLSRPPLGNIFLGPLHTSPDRRPTSMDQAARTEMAPDGLEAVVASGFESLRVRTISRAEPRTRSRPSADAFAAPMPRDDEMRQRSLSVINKANRTLLDLVARLDQCPPSPEASPLKATAADPAPHSPLTLRKTSNKASTQSLLFLRKPKLAGRRLVPKASRLQAPLPDLPPAVNVVMEKAGVDFVPGAAPIGFGQTVGAEQVVQSNSDLDSDGEPALPESDVPDDLLELISEQGEGSKRGSGSWSDQSATPPLPILGLPLPPPPNRVSPRRNNGLTLEVPPLRISSWHSRDQKSSDDTSAFASPDARDSATFDFTGEIRQLNENARASFFDTLHGADTAPVFPSLAQQAALAEAESGVAILAYKTGKVSSASSGNSTPLGALNRDFRLGSRPPSHSPPSVLSGSRPSFEAPLFRVSAPTPLPPGLTTLDDARSTTFGDSSGISAEELEAADVLPDESFAESKRLSLLSDSSTTHRGHRRTGHGDSAASFASFGSISSVGQVIHPGSRHPFSFDHSQSFGDDSLSPDDSRDSSESARTRKESEISVLTQSSFGAPLVDGHRISALFEFSSFRNGHSSGFSRHGHNDSINSATSTFSFHAPSADLAHRRNSSVASTVEPGEPHSAVATGPPISLFNQTRPYKWKGQRHARSGSTDSVLSSRSSVPRIPRATGRPDWARHNRQQSSADSSFSATLAAGRPGLGDRMFSPDQAVPLFPISASPQGSPDDSFRSDSFQLELREHEAAAHSDSSDSLSVDECRTSIDSGFPTYRFVHERAPSIEESAESVFGAGDDSFLRPFNPKGRPLSGASMFSSDGDVDPENDTFAFKRATRPEELELRLPVLGQTHDKERPVSMLSTGTSEADFDDTFAFHNGETHIIEPGRYTLPVLRAEIKPRLSPQASPLRVKRKDEHDDIGRARKARLVSYTADASTHGQGLKERLSLEDSCLTVNGEDASFNSSDLAHFCQAFHISAPSNLLAKPRASVAGKRAAAGQKLRPPTLTFSPDAPVASPLLMADSMGTDSSRLLLNLRQLSLDSSATSPAGTTRKPKFVPGHRSRLSGPSASVLVHATIPEEQPYDGPVATTGTGTPGLSCSPASSPLSDAYDFPSPIFLLSREPDIVAFDDDPDSFEAIRGWRTWERDAQYEYGRSQAMWADTNLSFEELAHFTPPKKLSQVQAFVQESSRSYKRLSGSFLKHKWSSSRTDARLHASPYFVAPEPVVPAKTKTRAGKLRPTSIKTKFAGVDIDAQPESARLASAKFAAFAPLPPASASTFTTTRPPSSPPSLAVFAPLSPLKVSFLTEQAANVPGAPAPPNETLEKKARRVSSNVRRERLGWGRRKTSVDHGGDLVPVKSKRSSLQIQRDAPAVLTKLRPASLTNKENVAGGLGPLSVRPRAFRTTAGTAMHRAAPLRA